MSRKSFVLLKISRKFRFGFRVLMDFQNTVVFSMGWLTMGQRHDKEISDEFFHLFAFLQNIRHHLIWSGFSDSHHISILALTKHSIPFKSLTLVRNLIAICFYITDVHTNRLQSNSNEFGYFEVKGMVKQILLLFLSHSSDFF